MQGKWLCRIYHKGDKAVGIQLDLSRNYSRRRCAGPAGALVGERALAGGAVRGKLALVQLDQVLGLAAGAVDIFVEMASLAVERGDDIRASKPRTVASSRATTRRSHLHEQAA